MRQAQLPLFARFSTDALAQRLTRDVGRPVSLTLTDNTSSMLSAIVSQGVLHIRLHWMFLDAPPDVIEETGKYLIGKCRKTPRIDAFVEENAPLIRKRPRRYAPVRPRGRFHDLSVLFRELNEKYFGGALSCAVTWGRKVSRRAVRFRTLGSYCAGSDRITMSRLLDAQRVPRYYVKFILYHEMLHARLGVRAGRIHTEEFLKREREYEEYDRALAFERRYAG